MTKYRLSVDTIFIGLIFSGMVASTVCSADTAATKARRIQDRARHVLEDQKILKDKWSQFDALLEKYANLITAAKGAHRRMAYFCAAYGYMPTDRILRTISSTTSKEKQEEYRDQQIACDRLEDLKNNIGIALKKVEEDKGKKSAEIEKLDIRKQSATNTISWPPDLDSRLVEANKQLKALEDETALLITLRDEATSL